MRAFYILTIKHLPYSGIKPTRIKISCKRTHRTYTEGQIDEYRETHPIYTDSVFVAAEMFTEEVINGEFKHPTDPKPYKVIGYGEGQNGIEFVVDQEK